MSSHHDVPNTQHEKTARGHEYLRCDTKNAAFTAQQLQLHCCSSAERDGCTLVVTDDTFVRKLCMRHGALNRISTALAGKSIRSADLFGCNVPDHFVICKAVGPGTGSACQRIAITRSICRFPGLRLSLSAVRLLIRRALRIWKREESTLHGPCSSSSQQ